MPDLGAILTRRDGVSWFVGTVRSVSGTSVTVEYADGQIPNVGYLDSYLPAIGDTVHVLSYGPMGCLVLGSNNYVPAIAGQPRPTGAAVIATATQWASYGPVANTWVGGAVEQEPTRYGLWFYAPSAFAAVAGLTVARFEIEVTLLSGGPPEFVAHRNPTPTGALLLRDAARHAPMTVPVGVPTWVPLPLDWAAGMFAGEVSGIGVGGGIYTGSYTPNAARLRVTPL